MDKDLFDEINYEIQLLIKSGFYCKDEIIEIILDEFFEEDISVDYIQKLVNQNYDNLELVKQDSIDFIRLNNIFNQLSALNDIITIHNAGYDLEEGVQDAFELFIHMKNNKENPQGFCFYSFEDIEVAIKNNFLSIVFGDFESNEKKALKIGKTVANALLDNGFNIEWDNTLNSSIKIKPFIWEKFYDEKEYSMDGALKTYLSFHK